MGHQVTACTHLGAQPHQRRTTTEGASCCQEPPPSHARVQEAGMAASPREPHLGGHPHSPHGLDQPCPLSWCQPRPQQQQPQVQQATSRAQVRVRLLLAQQQCPPGPLQEEAIIAAQWRRQGQVETLTAVEVVEKEVEMVVTALKLPPPMAGPVTYLIRLRPRAASLAKWLAPHLVQAQPRPAPTAVPAVLPQHPPQLQLPEGRVHQLRMELTSPPLPAGRLQLQQAGKRVTGSHPPSPGSALQRSMQWSHMTQPSDV
jgi:hypothetical protein